jgi:hypothetical protein
MKGSETALENIRDSINTAEALRMKSSAVLVRDLKILLELAESAAASDQEAFVERLSARPEPGR